MQIDIIIPSYERPQMTRRAVASVQAQTHDDWRVIVADDGSGAATVKTLRSMAAEDERITVVTGSNAGPQAARQRGYEHSTSDLVALLDSDDYWLPRKLELQLAAIADFDVALCWHRWVRDGRQTKQLNELERSGPMRPYLTTHNMSIPLIRRAAIERIGGLLPAGMRSLRNAEGVEFYCRLGQESTYIAVPEVLVECESHESTRSSDNQGQTREGAANLAYVVERHGGALAAWPEDLAALLARTGVRHVASGQGAAGLRYLARSVAAAPALRQRLGIVGRFGPYTMKCLLFRGRLG